MLTSEDLTPAQWQLWQHVERLAPFVKRGLHATHPVRVAFDKTHVLNLADDEVPEPDRLALARDLFYAMPLAEQRRVLNGWRPQPHPPTKAHLIGCLDSEPVARVLAIECRCDQRTGRPELDAFNMFDIPGGGAPVRVTIREGTKPGEALGALRAAMELVDREWESLIDGDAGGSDAAGEFTQAPCDAGDATARRELAGAAA